jgi:hypothetical protein
MAFDSVAGYAHDEGRYAEALDLNRQSLRQSMNLGDVQHVLDSLSRVAKNHVHMGRPALAAELLSASLALHEEHGIAVPLYQQRRRDDLLAQIDQQLTPAQRDEAWERGASRILEEAVQLALED